MCDKSFPSEDAWEKHKDTKEHWRCGACERTFALRAKNLWQHQSDTGHDDSESDSDPVSSEESEDESEEEQSPGSELLDRSSKELTSTSLKWPRTCSSSNVEPVTPPS